MAWRFLLNEAEGPKLRILLDLKKVKNRLGHSCERQFDTLMLPLYVDEQSRHLASYSKISCENQVTYLSLDCVVEF